jgi:cell division protein FtsB
VTPEERARVAKRRLLVTGALMAGLVLVAVAFLFLFPIKTWAGQRSELSDERARLELLQRENARLDADARKLQTDAEIERLARERFDLVRPGEEAYAILPAPTSTTTTAAPAR